MYIDIHIPFNSMDSLCIILFHIVSGNAATRENLLLHTSCIVILTIIQNTVHEQTIIEHGFRTCD